MGIFRFNTVIGLCVAEFLADGLVKVTFPADPVNCEESWPSTVEKKGAEEDARLFRELLEKYFRGENVDFTLVRLSLDTYSPFFKKVCEAARSIPYGEVMSYRDVAVKAGSPGAARAVGRVMACNPMPILIPCHRVVAVNGVLTGYSALGGIRTKELLLRMEGVRFSRNGTVITAKS